MNIAATTAPKRTSTVSVVATETRMVAMSSVDSTDVTYRFRLTLDIDELTESLRTQGQIVPIVVRVRGDRKYQVLCGFRRMAALRALGHTYVRADVRDINDADAFSLAVSENTQRQNFDDLDRAHAVVQYRAQFHKGIKEIAGLMSLSPRQVMRLEKLTQFPPYMQEALRAHRVPATHLLVLMEHFDLDTPELVLRSWVCRLENTRMSVVSLRERLHADDKWREGETTEPGGSCPRAPRIFEARDANAGVRVVRVFAHTFTLADMTPFEREVVARDLRALLGEIEGQAVHSNTESPAETGSACLNTPGAAQ